MIENFQMNKMKMFHCMKNSSQFPSVYLVPDAKIFPETIAI